MIIHSLVPEKFGMVPTLKHFALPKNIDDVGVLDRGQPMCHGDGCPPFGDSFERGLDELFALCLVISLVQTVTVLRE